MKSFKAPKKVKYTEFRNLVFRNISSEKDKHKLFYYSLFDPSSWEEVFTKTMNIEKFMKELQENIYKTLKSVSKEFWKKYLRGQYKNEPRKDYFFKECVYTDMLCKFLIACELEERKIAVQKSGVTRKELYPDIICRKGQEKVFIEIKRIISGNNFRNVVKETIEKIKNNREAEKVIICLIFPSWKGDGNYQRMSQLIKGYYFVEDYIEKEISRKIKVICHYITKNYSPAFSFRSFISKLVDNIKKI